MYENHIAIKYEVSGRNKKSQARKDAAELWFRKAADFTADQRSPAASAELAKAFDAYTKKTNVVTQALHSAVVHWVSHYNSMRHNAHQVETNQYEKKKKKKKVASTRSCGPPLVCFNSPIEADDQLAYFYRCGFIDVILTIDSDLLALGCFHFVTDGIMSASPKPPRARGFTEERLVARGVKIFKIEARLAGSTSPPALRDFLRQLFCCLSCLVGNDYVHGAMP
jgi:hypothetical protein